MQIYIGMLLQHYNRNLAYWK